MQAAAKQRQEGSTAFHPAQLCERPFCCCCLAGWILPGHALFHVIAASATHRNAKGRCFFRHKAKGLFCLCPFALLLRPSAPSHQRLSTSRGVFGGGWHEHGQKTSHGTVDPASAVATTQWSAGIGGSCLQQRCAAPHSSKQQSLCAKQTGEAPAAWCITVRVSFVSAGG